LAAGATKRIRLGPVALSPFEMHPVHAGLALLALDEIAPGRACLVLGAGGDLAATLGLPARGRVEAVEECIDIVRALAAGGEVSYSGKHFQVNGLFSPWRSVRMDRLYLGANRPRMLRLAAPKANGVMVTDMPTGSLGRELCRSPPESSARRAEGERRDGDRHADRLFGLDDRPRPRRAGRRRARRVVVRDQQLVRLERPGDARGGDAPCPPRARLSPLLHSRSGF